MERAFIDTTKKAYETLMSEGEEALKLRKDESALTSDSLLNKPNNGLMGARQDLTGFESLYYKYVLLLFGILLIWLVGLPEYQCYAQRGMYRRSYVRGCCFFRGRSLDG